MSAYFLSPKLYTGFRKSSSLQQKVHCIITYVVDCNLAIRNRSGEMIMVERDDDFWIMDEQTFFAQPLLITTSKLNDCANIVYLIPPIYTHTGKWRTKKKQTSHIIWWYVIISIDRYENGCCCGDARGIVSDRSTIEKEKSFFFFKLFSAHLSRYFSPKFNHENSRIADDKSMRSNISSRVDINAWKFEIILGKDDLDIQ